MERHKFLDDERKRKGLSVCKIAQLTGISMNHLSKVFSTKVNLFPKTITLICDALDIDYTGIVLITDADEVWKEDEED